MKLVELIGGWRPLAAAGLIAAAGVGSSLAYGDRGGTVRVPGATPAEMAALLPADRDGRIVVDTRGRPVLGPDGEPLRVAGDGQTLTDSSGTPLRSRSGRTLRVGRDGSLPAAARSRPSAKRRPSRKRRRRAGSDAPVRRPKAKAPILVGIPYQDPEEVQAAYEAQGADSGAVDIAPAARAVADHINANGGIAGRHVELRLHRFRSGNTPMTSVLEAVCAEMARPPRPLVVVGRGYMRAFGPCLAKSGIAYVGNPTAAPRRALLDQYRRTLFAPSSPAIDRTPAVAVRQLVDAGFFGNGTRVGLVWPAEEDYRAGAEAMKAALKSAGVTLTAEREMISPTTYGDVAAAVAEMASTALRFNSRGVNRMLAVEAGGEFTGLFMTAAEAQGFRPTWGLTTQNGPAQLARHVSAQQLRGAIGIGWSPIIDVLADGDGATSDTHGRCSQIFRAAGVPVGGRSVNGQGLTYAICDGLLLTKSALERSRSVSPAVLAGGIAALGDSFTSALGFATRFGPDRSDGMAGYRALGFDSACACFEYRGPVRPAG